MQEILGQTQSSNIFLLKPKESFEERQNRLIAEHKGKLASSFEELLGPNTDQTQEEIQAEVDIFLQLREEWRNESREKEVD